MFVSEAMDSFDVEKNEIRQKSTLKAIKRKNYQKDYHASDKQKKRRRQSEQVRQHHLGKLDTNKNRHIPDKVKPGETVSTHRKKSTPKKNKVPRKTKCGNCHQIGHNRKECQEPVMICPTQIQTRNRKRIRELF